MDAELFIYFPRDPGHNIHFKVFDGQDKLQAPPPPESTKNGTSFNHSPILPTAILNT